MKMMTNAEFLKSKSRNIVEFRMGGFSYQGLKVGDHLILLRVGNYYFIYNFHLKIPLILCKFSEIKTAYSLAKSISRHYGELLSLLSIPEYAVRFFELTKWTVNNGHKMLVALDYLVDQDIVDETSLRIAFDMAIV